MLYLAGILLITICGLLWFILRDSHQSGINEEKAKAMGDMLDEVKRAKMVRDAINSDPTGKPAKLLRDKYTR